MPLEKILYILVLILLGQNYTGKIPCYVALETSDNIAQEKSFLMLSTFSWGNIALIALINTFCNVVQKAPDNIGHEKILLNVVLILLGQNRAVENPGLCYPRDSR